MGRAMAVLLSDPVSWAGLCVYVCMCVWTLYVLSTAMRQSVALCVSTRTEVSLATIVAPLPSTIGTQQILNACINGRMFE